METPPSSSCPSTPRWNVDRPFLTGRFHQETKGTSRLADTRGLSLDPFRHELIINELLYALVGTEGQYISIKRVHRKEDDITFQVDASTDLALQDYRAMVAQLEHQFRLGRLSIHGLSFYCQPLMASMQALSAVVKKASASNCTGSAVLNLLQSQSKAMAGDSAVRSLLEKMTQCASSAYLGILERWVYKGVIDDPYGEFFIAENKYLHEESLTQDYDAKYWKSRYSLKEGIPSFFANIAGTILTTRKCLNFMRECGHNVQVPSSENSKLMSFGSNNQYLECIKAAYNIASSELLNLIKKKYDLMGKLWSIKHYPLLDQI
ncbi:gamma-tubulin complex component 2-like isoform X3 [Hevea brasiliensis]|uniref:gamma-tubulin complex component 2-like isoform X3 n=1 Tax=Hevea brasiliensis TaxID=3981 RepID=UPI0025DF7868|nr:gamma-tubulin complex component 2-like isoform X3 [Hevea brasiliensis]XP_057984806.1 gamma-tubulin complex component 2-like isoform X3 [Hevea brasiliensis]